MATNKKTGTIIRGLGVEYSIATKLMSPMGLLVDYSENGAITSLGVLIMQDPRVYSAINFGGYKQLNMRFIPTPKKSYNTRSSEIKLYMGNETLEPGREPIAGYPPGGYVLRVSGPVQLGISPEDEVWEIELAGIHAFATLADLYYLYNWYKADGFYIRTEPKLRVVQNYQLNRGN